VTLLGSTGESPERQQAVLSTLMEHTPAGLILSPAEGSDTAQLRRRWAPMPTCCCSTANWKGPTGTS
jgi:DNA-binding LacI/PurR family transcriptional regulator